MCCADNTTGNAARQSQPNKKRTYCIIVKLKIKVLISDPPVTIKITQKYGDGCNHRWNGPDWKGVDKFAETKGAPGHRPDPETTPGENRIRGGGRPDLCPLERAKGRIPIGSA